MVRKKPYCEPQIVIIRTVTLQLLGVSLNQQGDVDTVDIDDEDYDDDEFQVL